MDNKNIDNKDEKKNVGVKVAFGVGLGLAVVMGVATLGYNIFKTDNPIDSADVRNEQVEMQGEDKMPVQMKMPKEDVKKFSVKEEAEWVNSYAERVLAFEDTRLLMEELDENIAKLSPDEAQKAVDGLMYVIYNNYSKIEFKEEFYKELDKVIADKGDINKREDLVKSTNKSFSDYAIKLLDQGYKFNPETVSAQLTFKINYKMIDEKYSKFINNDFSDMLKYLDKEANEFYIDMVAGKLKYDLIVSRILETEKFLTEHKESSYSNFYEESNNFYRQLYFGAEEFNNVYGEDNKLIPEALDHYKETIKKHSGTELAKNITDVVAKLEASSFVKTDDVKVFLSEMTELRTEYINPTTDNLTKEDVDKLINDATKELNENKK